MHLGERAARVDPYVNRAAVDECVLVKCGVFRGGEFDACLRLRDRNRIISRRGLFGTLVIARAVLGRIERDRTGARTQPRSGPLRNGCQLISRTRAGAGRSPKPTATAALGAVIADRLAGKSRRYFRIVAELIRRRSHAPVRRFLVHAG